MADVPAPEVSLDSDDGVYRAELINYIQKGGRIKDIRIRGPARSSLKEARKDGQELKKAAYKGGGNDPALFQVRARRKELESVKWKKEDLVGFEGANEKQEDQREKESEEKKQQDAQLRAEETHGEALARIAARDAPSTNYKPVGPNWKRPGSLTQLPSISGHPANSWMIHEKQDSAGKYRAWLFFNSENGKYYRQKVNGVGYIQAGVPNAPQDFQIGIRVGSANLAGKSGKKLDMAVILPELHKTGFLTKQPLEFLDKPAVFFVLCDGLRSSSAATEFCAKKIHTFLLPKLSARATEWEDFELVDLLRDAVEALDAHLMASPACFSGCGLAVGLIVGTRLVLGALGGTRCVLYNSPSAATRTPTLTKGAKTPLPQTNVRLVAGGKAHTVEDEDERLRVESAGNRLVAGTVDAKLASVSARSSTLSQIADERERLMLQIASATNPFATLGISLTDLKAGSNAIRKVFRKLSLVVHPDKVGDDLKQRAMSIFAKLEAASSAVTSMLYADLQATELLAQIDAAWDSGRLLADPSVALKLLGVPEGCGPKQIKQTVEKKFQVPLGRLQRACPRDVERALRTLEMAEESVIRGSVLWTPPEADEAVSVTRALGCKDLKSPVPLLTAGLAAECIEISPGTRVGVALLSDGAAGVTDQEVALQLAAHCPGRPRAAALRLVLSAARQTESPTAAICAFLDFESPNGTAVQTPAAKRARLAAKPERVRISHILLRWAGKPEDEFTRPGVPVPTRTQAEAEQELLQYLEEMSDEDPKLIGSRFKELVQKHSECASSLNVPYADLGWIELGGGADAQVEAAAFATPVNGLSDVVVSSRGAHLMYRLA